MVKHTDWIKEAQARPRHTPKCQTCAHTDAAKSTVEILEAMHKLKAKLGDGPGRVAMAAVYDHVRELHPDYTLTVSSWRNHLRRCCPELYGRVSG